MRDLEDLPAESLARALQHLIPGAFNDQRSARRLAKDGRKLWRELKVWPWAWLPDGYDSEWSRNPDVEEAWNRWIYPAGWVSTGSARLTRSLMPRP